MIAERVELSPFIRNWKNKSLEQATEELASYSLETKRIPDPYYLMVDQDGDLFSPSAKCKVKSIIKTDQRLGQLEYQAFDSISEWVRSQDYGVAVWFSPPSQDIYPDSKIIISELQVQDGIKQLFNRAIILDVDGVGLLEYAKQIADYSSNRPFLTHLNELRATPVFLSVKDQKWINIFQEVIVDQNLWDQVKNGTDTLEKVAALQMAGKILTNFSMVDTQIKFDQSRIVQALSQILGSKSGSCPVVFSGTAVQVFSQNAFTFRGDGGAGFSLKKSEWYCISCPVCGKKINCEVKPGEKCPNPDCGAIRECT